MRRRSVAEALATARGALVRMDPAGATEAAAEGAVLIDIRPLGDRVAEGEIPGAWVIDRNVLEWRLDPQCPHRRRGVDDSFYDRALILFCNDGYASSLTAAYLQELLGLAGATDLRGGYRAWAAEGRPTIPAPEGRPTIPAAERHPTIPAAQA